MHGYEDIKPQIHHHATKIVELWFRKYARLSDADKGKLKISLKPLLRKTLFQDHKKK